MKIKLVTRKFLNDLADQIYNPKTKTFLRLCNGTLQNGPDPTNPRRPMHCGLGELYFAMTGFQPETKDVNEDDVVALAVANSPVAGTSPVAVIGKLSISDDLKTRLIDEIYMTDENDQSPETKFKYLLDRIPGKNDDYETCTLGNFKKRSRRVAHQLRKAAKVLPA